MDRKLASEPNLAEAVRKAASEAAASAAPSRPRRDRGTASESNLHSHASSGTHRTGRSRRTRDSQRSSSSMASEAGKTLKQQQEGVQTEAMDRFLSALQVEAKGAVKDTELWTRKVKDDLQDQQNEKQRRKDQALQNQYQLRQQMEDNKMRRAEDRREYIEASSAHSFPLFTETFISLDEVTAYRDKQKQTFRQELTDQLQCINTMKNLKIKEDRDWADDRNINNIGAMTVSRKAERERVKAIGVDLVKNWDRDLRLANIKKAILSGKDVVSQTLGPGALEADGKGSRSRRS